MSELLEGRWSRLSVRFQGLRDFDFPDKKRGRWGGGDEPGGGLGGPVMLPAGVWGEFGENRSVFGSSVAEGMPSPV